MRCDYGERDISEYKRLKTICKIIKKPSFFKKLSSLVYNFFSKVQQNLISPNFPKKKNKF